MITNMPTQQEEMGERFFLKFYDSEIGKELLEKIMYLRVSHFVQDFLQSEISLAVAQREKEIFRKIKDYDFKENHLCGFNDGEQDCECFIAGLNVALSLITKPNDKQNN